MQKIKAVVLDMYGVIMKQTGDEFLPRFRDIFPDRPAEDFTIPFAKAGTGELTSVEMWKAFGFTGDLEKLDKEFLDTIEINEGFKPFAESIKGQYKLALLSNDNSTWSNYQRNRYDINKYFDAISISADLGYGKPDERIFTRTLELIGCKPEECIYADDRRSFLEPAERLGFHTVLFNSRHVDYDGRIVYSFPELKEYLMELSSTK